MIFTVCIANRIPKEAPWSVQNTFGSRHSPLIPLIILTLIALILRIWRLDGVSLWLDEIAQIRATSTSLQQAIQAARWHFGAAPLDYLVMHFTSYLGLTAEWLRLPSALLGCAGVFLSGLFACRAFGNRVGVLSVFLLTVSPLHIEWVRTARFYGLALFSAGFLSLAVLEHHRSNNRMWLTTSILGIAVANALYSYPYTVFLVLGVLIPSILHIRHRTRGSSIEKLHARLTIAAVLAGSLLFLPWLVWAHKIHGGQGHFATPTLNLESINICMEGLAGQGGIIGWLIVLTAAIGLFHRSRVGISAVIRKFAALGIILTLVGVPILDSCFGYFLAERQFICAQPLVLLMTAKGLLVIWKGIQNSLRRIPAWIGPICLVGVCLPLVVSGLHATRIAITEPKEDWRGLEEELSRRVGAGDIVVFTPYCMNDGVGFYWDSERLHWFFPQRADNWKRMANRRDWPLHVWWVHYHPYLPLNVIPNTELDKFEYINDFAGSLWLLHVKQPLVNFPDFLNVVDTMLGISVNYTWKNPQSGYGCRADEVAAAAYVKHLMNSIESN